MKTIEDHLHPNPLIIAERYKFSRQDQLEHESVTEYIVQMKQLSKYCVFTHFEDKLPDYLRARKKRLLGEHSLTYINAVVIGFINGNSGEGFSFTSIPTPDGMPTEQRVKSSVK